MDLGKVWKLGRRIAKGMEDAETFGTRLGQEKLIVAAYKTMTVEQLEDLRYILNQIIKLKKEVKRTRARDNDTLLD